MELNKTEKDYIENLKKTTKKSFEIHDGIPLCVQQNGHLPGIGKIPDVNHKTHASRRCFEVYGFHRVCGRIFAYACERERVRVYGNSGAQLPVNIDAQRIQLGYVYGAGVNCEPYAAFAFAHVLSLHQNIPGGKF